MKGGTSHNSGRKHPSKGNSQTAEYRKRVKSGQSKKASKLRALTYWSTEGRTSQDSKRKGKSKRHVLSRECRGREKSGQ
jgi:hypothetical protein